MRKALIFCMVLLLAGCALSLIGKEQLVTKAYRSDTSIETLRMMFLKGTKNIDKDPVYYHLNLASFDRFSGDFKSSVAGLETAKKAGEALEALSISETAVDVTINETLSPYKAALLERVLLHELQALNYLAADNLSNARVEILQADLLMQQDDGKAELASTRMLGGMVFEFTGENDNALIFYRKALDILNQRKITPPPFLIERMVVLTARLGLNSENRNLRKLFKLDPLRNQPQKLWVLHWTGIVSPLYGTGFYSHDTEGTSWWVAIPTYREESEKPTPAYMSDFSENRIETFLVESIDARIREDFSRREPAIIARAIARGLLKSEVIKKSGNSDDALLQSLLFLGAQLTEIADLRSWQALPSEIRIMSIAPKSGKFLLHWGGHRNFESEIILNKNETILVVLHDLSAQPVIYRN